MPWRQVRVASRGLLSAEEDPMMPQEEESRDAIIEIQDAAKGSAVITTESVIQGRNETNLIKKGRK
jgi:hypothetical protein